MLTVYIGDITEYLAKFVRLKHPAAFLCNNHNANIISTGVVYTSLGDLYFKNFVSLCNKADEIIFFPPKIWSSEILKTNTLIELNFLSNFKTVKNFKKEKFSNHLTLQDLRQTDNPQLWVVGCSYAHGLGVNPDEKFGSLISKSLNLPVSFLTHPGSSIGWAADQILRSNIKKNDIIIWGLTGCNRFIFYDNKNHHHMTAKNFSQNNNIGSFFKKNIFISDHVCFDAINRIDQVVNYLDKIEAKYVLGVFPLNLIDHEEYLQKYISQNENSCLLKYDIDNFVDYGTDDEHPGPKQHQIYADHILSFYKKKYLN